MYLKLIIKFLENLNYLIFFKIQLQLEFFFNIFKLILPNNKYNISKLNFALTLKLPPIFCLN